MADQHPNSDPGPDHREDASLPVSEEPLDPASQSLADALRASFRVLKLVMIFLVVVFLCSNVFIVDEQKEEVAVLRLGKLAGVYKRGLHFAWPYPVDEKIRVATAPKTVMIDAFWLNIKEEDQAKDLSELEPRGRGLDPAADGALLTGDRAIMHLKLQVQYRIMDARAFIRNVLIDEEQDETRMLQAVVQNASVASAARAEAEQLSKDPRPVVAAVRARAQSILDHMETGITLDQVAADKSYYPLQVQDAVLNVSNAEVQRNTLIQQALQERQNILNEAAGEAWVVLRDEIQRLDQLPDGPEREEVIERIGDILATKASGKAGELIKQAQNRRDKIKEDTLAHVSRFEALREEYQRSPELVRQRLLRDMLVELYSQPKVIRWFLTPDTDIISVWVGKDPKETRQAQRERAKKKAEGK